MTVGMITAREAVVLYLIEAETTFTTATITSNS